VRVAVRVIGDEVQFEDFLVHESRDLR
jgi:hypothetical protein